MSFCHPASRGKRNKLLAERSNLPKSQWKINKNQVVCILAYTNALIVIQCHAKAGRNEQTGAACKNIFSSTFYSEMFLLARKNTKSFQHWKLHREQTTKTQIYFNIPNINFSIQWNSQLCLSRYCICAFARVKTRSQYLLREFAIWTQTRER